jgi:hypothetical protein
MAGHVLKVLLTSLVFEYSFLLEDSREVSTVGIISPQLVMISTYLLSIPCFLKAF